MACDRCISAIRDTLIIGEPVECQCNYCGHKFLAGKPEQCITCINYLSTRTDDGYRYMCQNDDADGKENCSGYIAEEKDLEG